MDKGWIKIHRKILDWEWYDEPNTFRLFFHLLLLANHKEKKYRGEIIKIGQVMTGLELLSSQTKLTIRQIRTALKRLKSTNEIDVKTSSKGTIIQLINYIDYQIKKEQRQTNDKPTTNQRQTDDKPTTTNKNDNNDNNDNNVKKKGNEISSSENKITQQQKDDKYKEIPIGAIGAMYWKRKDFVTLVVSIKKNHFKDEKHLKEMLKEFIIELKLKPIKQITFYEFADYFIKWNRYKHNPKNQLTKKDVDNSMAKIPIG